MVKSWTNERSLVFVKIRKWRGGGDGVNFIQFVHRASKTLTNAANYRSIVTVAARESNTRELGRLMRKYTNIKHRHNYRISIRVFLIRCEAVRGQRESLIATIADTRPPFLSSS